MGVAEIEPGPEVSPQISLFGSYVPAWERSRRQLIVLDFNNLGVHQNLALFALWS